MGICQDNGSKKRQIITANQSNIHSSNNIKEKNENINTNNLIITHNNEDQFSKFPTKITDTNPQPKIFTSQNQKYEKAPSTLSSNSTATRIYSPNSPKIFNIEANLGEIEIPIFVEKNENITININYNNNIQNIWSFLKNEQPIDYLGYPNYKKYKDYNIGALLLRITGSPKIYHINNKIFSFKANSKGSLLFWANLNPYDYPIYEPKGFIQIIITGGNHIYENELNPPYDINKNNKKYNNFIIKEKKILKYINKARNNLLAFINDYFDTNNNEINQELKFYVNKYNFKRKELINDNKLNILSQEHCEYLCINGTNGKIDKDGINLEDKIKKKLNTFYCKTNIIYGINNPLLLVKRMIQDKYSKCKKNRDNIFFHQFKKVGICLREHFAYKYCCVIAFSE